MAESHPRLHIAISVRETWRLWPAFRRSWTDLALQPVKLVLLKVGFEF